MEWYYIIDGQREGPVDEGAIRELARSGGLEPDSLVWNETMGEQWAAASTVPGLFADAGEAAVPVAVVPQGDGTTLTARRLPGVVSCTSPVGYAWRYMKHMLFRPFDISKWFVLGFSAWLATLGEGGGGSFNYRSSFGGGGPGGRGGFDFDEMMEQARSFMAEYGGRVALIAGALILVGTVIGVVVLWLRSRGKFMLLDNVVHNRAEVSAPWTEFKQHGNSLLVWTFVYSLVCFLVTIGLLALTFFSVVLPCLKAQSFVATAVPGLAISIVLWLVFGVIAGYIGRFLEDFVVPIMYRFDLTATEAWRRFTPMFRASSGAFIIYGLFYLLLAMAAGICAVLFMIFTCCIGWCLLIIPYVGAVVMLPVTVFFRAYSLEYLAQHDPELVLLPEVAE